MLILAMMMKMTTGHTMLAKKRKSDDMDEEALSFMLGDLIVGDEHMTVEDGHNILKHMAMRFGNSANKARYFTDTGADSQGLWNYMSFDDEPPQETIYFQMSNSHRNALLQLFEQDEVLNWQNSAELETDEYDRYHEVFEITTNDGEQIRVKTAMFLESDPDENRPRLEMNFFQDENIKCART